MAGIVQNGSAAVSHASKFAAAVVLGSGFHAIPFVGKNMASTGPNWWWARSPCTGISDCFLVVVQAVPSNGSEIHRLVVLQ